MLVSAAWATLIVCEGTPAAPEKYELRSRLPGPAIVAAGEAPLLPSKLVSVMLPSGDKVPPVPMVTLALVLAPSIMTRLPMLSEFPFRSSKPEALICTVSSVVP